MAGRDNSVEDGYGRRITPMHINNILSGPSTKSVTFSLKRQEMVTLDFATDQTKHILLPYQILHWYMGTTADNNLNLQTFNKLIECSWGMDIHGADICIEVFAVTRERLLQGGSTNYKTYDFETSQNLYLITCDRTQETFLYVAESPITSRKPFNSPKTHATNTQPFDITIDKTTKEEIPQRHKIEKSIHFPRPGHYKYDLPSTSQWMENETDDTTNEQKTTCYVIPGAVHAKPSFNSTIDPSIIKTRAFQNTPLIQEGFGASGLFDDDDNDKDEWNIRNATWQRDVAYPMMYLAAPNIHDETGEMKWIYTVRMQTELHVTFHLENDVKSGEAHFTNKLTMPLVQTIRKKAAGAAISCAYTCVPYIPK